MSSFIKMYQLSGGRSSRATGFTGVLQTIARMGLVIISALIGIAVLVLTASAALVLVISIVIIGFLVFAWFWARAKFFGKPFGGQAFSDMKSAARAQSAGFDSNFKGDADMDGDVIDAHETPDGWSVNE